MKKLWIKVAVGLVALLVVAGLVVFFYLDQIVQKSVVKVGSAMTKTEVKLDGASVGLFSGSGELKGFSVANPPGFQSRQAVSVGSIFLSLVPSSVLQEKVVVRAIRVKGPEVTFEVGAGGSNLGVLLKNVKETGDPGKPAKNERKARERKLQVDELLIADARITVMTTLLGGKSASVVVPEIRLRDLGQGPDGITPAELTERILTVLLREATQAAATRVKVPEGAAPVLKGVGDLLNRKR